MQCAYDRLCEMLGDKTPILIALGKTHIEDLQPTLKLNQTDYIFTALK